MTLKLWREVEFKIVEDCGSRSALDTDFHLAKGRLPDETTRFASFEEDQFRRLKARNEWIKAAVCYPVFDAAEGKFFLHPIGGPSENAVVSLSICPPTCMAVIRKANGATTDESCLNGLPGERIFCAQLSGRPNNYTM